MCDEDGEYIEQSTTYKYNRVNNKYTYKIDGELYKTDKYFLDYKDAEQI